MPRIFKFYDLIPKTFLKNYLPKNLYRFLEKEPNKIRGRWGNIVDDDKNLNQKHVEITTNLANYDHCGPCGNDTIPKFEKKDS